MNKTKLLLTEGVDVYPDLEEIELYSIYKNTSRYLRAIRYIHHRIPFFKGCRHIWLNEWKSKLNNYKSIVIVDSIFDYTPIEYIKKNRPDVRLVFCFRNRVRSQISHATIHRDPYVLRKVYNCELWSYSKEDCDEFNMIQYNQFHLIPEELFNKNLPIEHDVFFIGEDKHRISCLMDLKTKLEQIGLTTKICVVPDPNVKYTTKEKTLLTTSLPYNEVLGNVLRSRCVIDIVGIINYGMTYRCLEAAVLKKKLITNYAGIKDVAFYNKNNIFVLGVDNDNELKDFVLSSYDGSIDEKLKVYSFPYFCNQVFCQVEV